MKTTLIVAIGKNGELGLDNKLLWKSPSDLSNFKRITEGHPIIMGRKTFESLPGILPNRKHIVITSDINNVKVSSSNPDVLVFEDSIADLMKAFKPDAEVFIIGGASIYRQALELDLVDELLITHMDWEGKADKFFHFDKSKWKCLDSLSSYSGDKGPNWVQIKYVKEI